MPWSQLQGWIAYADLEPFGYMRADINHGILCALIHNVNRTSKGKVSTPDDWIAKFGDRARKGGTSITKKAPKPLTDPAQYAGLSNFLASEFGDRSGDVSEDRGPGRMKGKPKNRKTKLNISVARLRKLKERGELPPDAE